VHNDQEPVTAVLSKGYPPILATAVSLVLEGESRRMKEYAARTLETDAVFPQVSFGLMRITFKDILQRRPALLPITSLRAG
jgi:hypothetical protein